MMEENEKQGIRLLSVMPSDRIRRDGHKWKQTKFCLSQENTSFFPFHFEGAETIEQVAQRDDGVSNPGDIKNLTGYAPGKLALADSAWAMGLNKMIPQVTCSLNDSAICWCFSAQTAQFVCVDQTTISAGVCEYLTMVSWRAFSPATSRITLKRLMLIHLYILCSFWQLLCIFHHFKPSGMWTARQAPHFH